jgi:hypothetical protein
MVPRHRGMMEPSAAIRARGFLELTMPIHEFVVVSPLLLDPSSTRSLVVGGVVVATTITADRLPDAASAVEVIG